MLHNSSVKAIKYLFYRLFPCIVSCVLMAQNLKATEGHNQLCIALDAYDGGYFSSASKVAQKLKKDVPGLSPLYKDLANYVSLYSLMHTGQYDKLKKEIKKTKTYYSFAKKAVDTLKAQIEILPLKKFKRPNLRVVASGFSASKNKEIKFSLLQFIYKESSGCPKLRSYLKMVRYFPNEIYVRSRVETMDSMDRLCPLIRPKNVRLYLIQRLFSLGFRKMAFNQSILFEREINKYGFKRYFKTGKEILSYIKILTRLGRTEEARKHIQNRSFFRKNSRNSLRLIAKTYLKEGDREKTRKILLKMYRVSKFRSEWAKFLISWIDMQQGNYKKAAEGFSDLRERFPRGNFRFVAKWYYGYTLYRSKDYQGALNIFQTINPKSSYYLRSRYWTGVIRLWEGKNLLALDIFNSIVKNYPLSYYALMANQRILSHKLNQTPNPFAGTHQSFNLPEEKIEFQTANYLPFTELKKVKKCGLPLPVDNIVGSIIRKDKLWKKKNGLSLLKQINELGSYRTGIWFAYRVSPWDRDIASIEGKEVVFKAAYPLAFLNIISPYANHRSLPLPLILAIIREESAFLPSALSPVGARGLMQIMPSTGEKIAGHLKEDSFHPNDLSSPFLSIKYGSWYLQGLVDKYDGNLAEAIGSYNAGPQAVTHWLKNKESMMVDEFCEEIPYRETRKYVKKVLKSYYVYSMLLFGKVRELRLDTPLFIANKWKEKINF